MARILFLDSTAVVPSGPGSPAFFSRYLIDHLKAQSHDVTILPHFDARAAQSADAVVTEWANGEAYEAAASGLCKRLIVRLRGFDAHGPLDRLEWGNVDALVYESPFLRSYVEKRFPGLRGFRSHVIPSGVDVQNIPFKERKAGPVVAMVGRADAAKGYQLALEWARTRPDVKLHVALALGEANSRLVEYLRQVKPPNVAIVPAVDTVEWLNEIDANFLLSASIWETLGYTIAEALAAGIKPLMHAAPGATLNWPINIVPLWVNLGHLDTLVFHDVPSNAWASDAGYHSRAYRAFVESNLDAAKQSKKFADLVFSLPARTTAPKTATIDSVLVAAVQAVSSADLPAADALVLRFRELAPATPALIDSRVGLALGLAFRYYAADDLSRARTWALRAMADEASVPAMCLLGEIALGEDDLEGAERWYSATSLLTPTPSRYPDGGLVAGREARLEEISAMLDPKLTPADVPSRYLIVVAVRNAEKYIGGCLASVKTQRHQLWKCVVMDDGSTDNTFPIALRMMAHGSGRFYGHTGGSRCYSLRNIVCAIREHGRPNDVIIILDGDDQLAPDALQRLDRAYRAGAWLTYGNFVTSSGKRSWMPPYPLKALRNGLVRSYPWRVSHPKTFRFELFQHLTDEDFTHEGKWFQTAGDVALMLPMLELAAERSVYIPDTLYVYNDENEANDHKVDPEGQVRVRDLIYAKPRRERLEKL